VKIKSRKKQVQKLESYHLTVKIIQKSAFIVKNQVHQFQFLQEGTRDNLGAT